MASALGYLHDNNIIYRLVTVSMWKNLFVQGFKTGKSSSWPRWLHCTYGLWSMQGGHEGWSYYRYFLWHTRVCFFFIFRQKSLTCRYLAPEIVMKKPYERSVDWWCLGAVLYEMFFGLPPFYSRDHQEMYDKIVNHPLRFKHPISTAATDIVTGVSHAVFLFEMPIFSC